MTQGELERIELEAEIHSLVDVKAKARFALAYKQLLPTTVVQEGAEVMKFSEEELDRRFNLLRLKPEEVVTDWAAPLGVGKSYRVVPATVAKAKCAGAEAVSVAVAAKMSSHGFDSSENKRWDLDEALLIEARLLSALKHRGVLELIGVVTVVSPIVVCTRQMSNGNLASFLRACRPKCGAHAAGFEGGAQSDLKPRFNLTFGDVVTMVERLVAGCAFLESYRIVHRDLAAKNVLVGENPGHVVLADLGGARSVLGGDYVSTSNESPIRWMAPEALQSAVFSHRSVSAPPCPAHT